MPVEVINIVLERDETVDERGTEGVEFTPPALYLDVALSSYDKRRSGDSGPS